MKRFISFFLLIVMCLSFVMLSACKAKNAENSGEGNTNTVNKSTTDEVSPEASQNSSLNVEEDSSASVSDNESQNVNENESESASEAEETAPDILVDYVEEDTDIYAVYSYALKNIKGDFNFTHFEVLENTPSEDGKSANIVYSLEDDSQINYYKATIEKTSEDKWAVKENEFSYSQEK